MSRVKRKKLKKEKRKELLKLILDLMTIAQFIDWLIQKLK